MNSRRSNQRGARRAPDSSGRSDARTARDREASRYAARSGSFDPSAYGRRNRPPSSGSGSAPRASSGRSSDEASANSYGRRVSQAEYARQRKRKKRKKILLISLALAVAVILCGAGAAFAYYQTLSGNLHKGIDDDLLNALGGADAAPVYDGDPFYMLLMGTDGSAEREESAEYAGDSFRSDSMILARIDPKGKKATLVSLHRDTLVDMGPEYGQNKLNAAHAFGGAAFTVETVSKLAGVPISHYAEINFDGFKEIVDALGGVEVEVPMEIDDEDAGGHLDAGLQTLNGDQALILCRARHAYDEFGDGDTYRAANQRLVLSAIAKKMLSTDVATLTSTVTTLTRYVTTDLEITEILSIANSMRGLDPERDLYTAMEPTTSSYIDGGWYEFLNEAEWKEMMSRVDQGLPPTEEDIIDEGSGTVLATTGSGALQSERDAAVSTPVTQPKTGKVVVKNGNGVEGAANEAAEKLTSQGYTVETGNADGFDYSETIVVYERSNQANEAKEIANTIGVGRAQLNDGAYAFEGDFLVVLGADW